MNTQRKINISEVEQELLHGSDSFGGSIESKQSLQNHTLKWERRPTLREEEEGNWIFSYADMMTLLFGFFVIIASLSVPDPKRIQSLRKMASSAMNIAYEDPYAELLASLTSVLKETGASEKVAIEQTAEGLNLVSSGTVFFDTASVELRNEAKKIVDQLAAVLIKSATQYNVIVEGHTDDVPVSTEKFPSNWELSAGRASRVVRLLEERGFPHTQLRPLGFADTRPVETVSRTSTKREVSISRAKNRRIVIRIRQKFDPVADFPDPTPSTDIQ